MKAQDALAFAQKQNWKDQEVVVYMLFAGALLKEKSFKQAINEYRTARKTAKLAKKDGHPAASDLILQTWFGEAGAHLAAGNFNWAAECYDQAAVIAQEVPNMILAIEAFRMAAFCYIRIPKAETAIERGMLAMQLGEKLKPKARTMTTLPLAAMDVLRVVEPERVREMENIKRQQKSQQKNATKIAEQRAAKVETEKDPKLTEAIQQHLAEENKKADTLASQQLHAVVTSSTERFQQYFNYAGQLLGENWPLTNDVALPAVSAG